jgi:diguanylate cyclase (GGDEF)-like protein
MYLAHLFVRQTLMRKLFVAVIANLADCAIHPKHSSMRLRRLEDRELSLLRARPTGWISGDDFSHRGGRARGAAAEPDRAPPAAMLRDRCQPAGDLLLLLLEVEGDDGLLVAGAATYRVPGGGGQGDDELFSHAARGAAALREERLRAEKRQKLPDQLIAYFEALNASDTEAQALHALAVHALRIVGGHTALPLVRDAGREMLRAPIAPDAPGGHRAALLWDERLGRPGLLLAEEARHGGGSAWAAPLFGDPDTALVAHVPLGDGGCEGVLVLTERREERIFIPDDWDVLRALALQAEMALRRVRLIESVRSLSLTDPLTGLANRRRMDVVMEHAWAAAVRGEALAVLVLDLDDFKRINDAEGHQAGDRLLCSVADALRQEARRSDVVVRYGGDEFLAILPGGDAAGARALAERVRGRIGDRVGISHGVAVYREDHTSPDDLIREADHLLYDHKRRRRADL